MTNLWRYGWLLSLFEPILLVFMFYQFYQMLFLLLFHDYNPLTWIKLIRHNFHRSLYLDIIHLCSEITLHGSHQTQRYTHQRLTVIYFIECILRIMQIYPHSSPLRWVKPQSVSSLFIPVTWEWSQPMKEDITYVRPSLIGCDLSHVT